MCDLPCNGSIQRQNRKTIKSILEKTSAYIVSIVQKSHENSYASLPKFYFYQLNKYKTQYRISHFGFKGETLVLIAPVPGHCLHSTLDYETKLLSSYVTFLTVGNNLFAEFSTILDSNEPVQLQRLASLEMVG